MKQSWLIDPTPKAAPPCELDASTRDELIALMGDAIQSVFLSTAQCQETSSECVSTESQD